jgi:hypothetical protein
MSSTGSDRPGWEYADGPTVGRDVPITSAPREEVAPGVLADPPAQPAEKHDSGNGRNGSHRTEEREVRAADPEFSNELNESLTQELRDVVGAERVRVPADRPHVEEGDRPHPRSAVAYLNMHRLQVVRALFIALTFGAVISLITNDWWFLVLAVGLHALGTMAVTMTVIRMTTITERPSPELAAALSDAGVNSPDEYFSRLVDEFRPASGGGAGEVISAGHNERTASTGDDAMAAAAEESSAMTPTAEPSRPAGQGGAPDILIFSTIIALLILSIVIPPVMGGGWMWMLTAVLVPLLAGWALLQWLYRSHGDRLQLRGPVPLTAIVVCTALAVIAFGAVVAFAFQH